MDIVVYAEDLRAYSSATPSRDMLRELMAVRAGDPAVSSELPEATQN